MDIVTHANTLPWLIDPAGFLTLLEYLLEAVALSLFAVLLYAGLHRLLAHPEAREKQPGVRQQAASVSNAAPVKVEDFARFIQWRNDDMGVTSMTYQQQEQISHEA